MANILAMYITYFDPLVKDAYQTKTTNLIAGTTIRSGEKVKMHVLLSLANSQHKH